jgi:uncharacterized membrane protein YfcA
VTIPPGLAEALALPGIWACAAAVLTAGVVYGFAGFGAALIAMPVLTRHLEPEAAVSAFALAGLGSAATMLPRVWPQADRRATLWMILAAALTAPWGLWVLAHADPDPLRWAICALVAATLLAVMSGWRLRLGSGPGARLSLGAATGLVGGTTGLTGPLVIVTNLASGDGSARMRANLAAFLTSLNFVFLPILAAMGVLTSAALWTGALFLPLYVAGTEIGHRLFRPGRERLYRALAYAAVAGAVLLGLPVWDG